VTVGVQVPSPAPNFTVMRLSGIYSESLCFISFKYSGGIVMEPFFYWVVSCPCLEL
jgi:hypothetical protein